jgi:hypothetical protein
MGAAGSSPHSQQPTTETNAEKDKFNHKTSQIKAD